MSSSSWWLIRVCSQTPCALFFFFHRGQQCECCHTVCELRDGYFRNSTPLKRYRLGYRAALTGSINENDLLTFDALTWKELQNHTNVVFRSSNKSFPYLPPVIYLMFHTHIWYCIVCKYPCLSLFLTRLFQHDYHQHCSCQASSYETLPSCTDKGGFTPNKPTYRQNRSLRCVWFASQLDWFRWFWHCSQVEQSR